MRLAKTIARKLWHAALRMRRRLARSILGQLESLCRQRTDRPPCAFRALQALYVVKRYLQDALTLTAPVRVSQWRHWKREIDTAFLSRLYLWSTRSVSRKVDLYPPHVRNNRLSRVEAERMRQLARRFRRRPLISIVVPVYDARHEWLDRLVASVLAQTYDRWELILIDDASPSPATRAALEQMAALDERIRIERLATNTGVSRATNRGAQLAGGEFLAFVDHDDELMPDALWWVVEHLQRHPQCDLIYTDEEMFPAGGEQAYPAFKPDFSPELLTSFNYMCHLLVVRTEVFRGVGGLRPETDGAQDYDLILRVLARTQNVGHVPRVLYRWHVVPWSISRVENARTGRLEPAGHIDQVSAAVVQAHLDRMELPATCLTRDGWCLPTVQPVDHGKVSIIICTRDNPRYLRTAIRSIERRTDYPNYEILIVDNGSRTRLARWYLRRLARRHRVLTIPSGPEGFSFSRLNNEAARQVDGKFLLFLNDDTKVVSRGWLSALVGYAVIPNVGATAARLRYANGSNQHSGVILGAYGWGPWHALMNLPASERQKFKAYLSVPRNWSALTAACLLTHRDLFLELGGFDESSFAVSFNDVDYCVRLRNAGYRCVCVPQAELIHYEGRSRGRLVDPKELAALRAKLGPQRDPYWNPSFSREFVSFAINPRRQARKLFDRFVPRVLVAARASQPGDAWPHWEPIVTTLQRHGRCRFDVIPDGLCSSIDWTDLTRRKLESEQYDVLLAHGPEMTGAIEAARDAGVPSIWNLPGRLLLPEQRSARDLTDFLRICRALELPYQVVFSNPHSKAWAQCGAARGNFIVMDAVLFESNPAIDDLAARRFSIRRRFGCRDDDVVVLALVSAQERGGLQTVLAAYERLGAKFRRQHRTRLFVVAQYLPNHTDCARIRRRVERIGPDAHFIADPAGAEGLLAAGDLVVAHCVDDLRPQSVLKALAYALPVIGTSLLQYSDVVYPGATGLAVRPFNVGALARAMQTVIGDTGRMRRFGANGRYWLDSRAIPEEVMNDWADLILEAAELCPAKSSSLDVCFERETTLGAAAPASAGCR